MLTLSDYWTYVADELPDILPDSYVRHELPGVVLDPAQMVLDETRVRHRRPGDLLWI